MLTAAAVSLPYVFVSRAIFPAAKEEEERSLEEHYLKHRELILIMLVVPMFFSVGFHIWIDKVPYPTIDLIWAAARIALPLVLIPFANRTVQRSGLVALNLLQLAGLFR